MKTTQLLIPTQKELPSDAQIISHQLMIRAGLISKLASGLYSYLPVGIRILHKVEAIIREEMNNAGAQEILMPVAQPAELWQQSGRWDEYGPELLRFNDRHNRAFCLGPTHEEVISNLASQYIHSYKQLPINLYQIQTKFRDEIRPRFGVMRSREFIMKDAYSFHLNQQSLKQTYELMHQTYSNIFDRIGFKYCSVLANSGAIGGDNSHEFHVLSDSGEDQICFSNQSDYAANIERCETLIQANPATATKPLKKIETPNQKTINEIVKLLDVDIKQTVKTLVVESQNGGLIALVLRGDHTLNEVKAEKIDAVASPLVMATEEKIKQILGCSIGFIGVTNLTIPMIIDYAAATLSDFIAGANEDNKHLTGVNWHRDVGTTTSADLRNAVNGDNSPDGKGQLIIKRGIEVGHIFQLGTKYSSAMKANIISENGKAISAIMGCYGIGVTRIIAAAIEQNHDNNGIIFPESIAPFQLVIVPINYHKSSRVKNLADKLYKQFEDANIEVLLDNRKERPGIMFADSELLGIPHRIVISDTHTDNGNIEYKSRSKTEKHEVNYEDSVSFIKNKLNR